MEVPPESSASTSSEMTRTSSPAQHISLSTRTSTMSNMDPSASTSEIVEEELEEGPLVDQFVEGYKRALDQLKLSTINEQPERKPFRILELSNALKHLDPFRRIIVLEWLESVNDCNELVARVDQFLTGSQNSQLWANFFKMIKEDTLRKSALRNLDRRHEQRYDQLLDLGMIPDSASKAMPIICLLSPKQWEALFERIRKTAAPSNPGGIEIVTSLLTGEATTDLLIQIAYSYALKQEEAGLRREDSDWNSQEMAGLTELFVQNCSNSLSAYENSCQMFIEHDFSNMSAFTAFRHSILARKIKEIKSKITGCWNLCKKGSFKLAHKNLASPKRFPAKQT